MDGLPIFRAALTAAGRNPDAARFTVDDIVAARKALALVDDFLARQCGEKTVLTATLRLDPKPKRAGPEK